MTVNAKTIPGNFATDRTDDTAAAATVQYAASGAGLFYSLYVDNTANSAKSYVKIYDATSGVTVGTTVPEYIIMIPAGVARQFVVKQGFAFSTGLSYAVVTTGGTAGTTAPTSPITVRFIYT